MAKQTPSLVVSQVCLVNFTRFRWFLVDCIAGIIVLVSSANSSAVSPVSDVISLELPV